MPFSTEYQNTVQPAQVVVDNASENLVPNSVWLQHVLREMMPSGTQTKEIPKKGELGRIVLPENTKYTYGAYSEYTETSTLLNAIKSVVISRITKEQEKFGRRPVFSTIGMEQGKALGVGMEEDIATLVAGATSSLTAAGTGATILDLMACALDVQISTNGHANTGRDLVAVMHPKAAFELGVIDTLNGGTNNLTAMGGNPMSSIPNVFEKMGASMPTNGRVTSVGGIQIYTTNVIDDDGTNFRNAIFDPSRAFVGMWDDSVDVMTQIEIEYFRNRLASCHFSDFEIHFPEAICRLESPVL